MSDVVTYNAQCAHLPAGFGEGWMTKNAIDLARIATVWAGFDAQELARRLARVRPRGERINAATVERVLAEMSA